MTRLTRSLHGTSTTPRLVTATGIVLAFLGATSFLGGLEMLLRPEGSDVLPGTLLDDLPVDTFVVPGIVLASLFGIGAATVAYGLWRQPFLPALRWVERDTGRHWAWAGTLVTGWALTGWLLLELALLGAPWAGATAGSPAGDVLYVLLVAAAAWLLVAPWTREVRDDLRIIDLTILDEATPEPMVSHRVLVAYGSKRGGTAGLAVMVGDALERHGFDVDVRPARQVRDVHGYGAVLVGGALHAARWHTDARWFTVRHRRVLRQRPVWLFSSGPLDDSATQRDIPPVWHARIAMDRVAARGHATFGGVLEEEPDGLIAGSMAQSMAGDWRDPQHVARWVAGVAAELAPLTPRVGHVPGSDRPLPPRPTDDVAGRMTMTPRRRDGDDGDPT